MTVAALRDVPSTLTPPQALRPAAIVVLLAVIYFLTGWLGLMMAIPPGVASPVWPPSGLALGAVLLLGSWVWPGIWVGSFVLNVITLATGPQASLLTAAGVAAGIATGSTLQPLLGAAILRRAIGTRPPLDRTRDALSFAAFAAALGCMTSATVGVTSVCLAGIAPWSQFRVNWVTWWLGDAAGVLILAPLLISWSRRAPGDRPFRWLEMVLCFALVLVIGTLAFSSPPGGTIRGGILAFLLLPFLLWAAFRFGAHESLTVLFGIAALAVWGTIHHRGPFALQSLDESRLLLEAFLSVAAMIALFVGAAVTERRATERSLRQVNVELEERVRERTAELQVANEALTAEVSERKLAETRLRRPGRPVVGGSASPVHFGGGKRS